MEYNLRVVREERKKLEEILDALIENCTVIVKKIEHMEETLGQQSAEILRLCKAIAQDMGLNEQGLKP